MTATLSIREGTIRDRDAILRLRKIVFAKDDPEKQDPRFWDWQFVDCYAGPGRFFVAESDGQIVGQSAFQRQRYGSDQVFRGALQIDAMTHPDFRRQKVYSRLVQYATHQMRDDMQVITAFQIRKAVLRGVMAGGLRKALTARVLLRLLPFSTKRSPGNVRTVEDHELVQMDALLRTTAIRQPRTVEFLRWRYRSNPLWHYEIDGFFEGSVLTAFVVHRATTLRRVRTLAIVDAGLAEGGEDDLRRLIEHVSSHARRNGLLLSATLMTRDHPAYRTLRRAWFFPGPHRFRVLLQGIDENLRWVERAPWALSWGDTDHL
jgi:GNAT superfamily N-acetyltransferase